MGDYTEIVFRADVDAEACEVITAARDGAERAWPDHPFFAMDRMPLVFSCTSAYFPDGNHFNAGKDNWGSSYYVSFRANLKNYHGEIDAFLDWVAPHVLDQPAFIGYSLYEFDEWPTLYRVEDGRLVTCQPTVADVAEQQTVVGELATPEIAARVGS